MKKSSKQQLIYNELRQPMPSKSLVEGYPVETGINPSNENKDFRNSSDFKAEDLMGLSWILFDSEAFNK